MSGQPSGSCEVKCDDNLLEHLATTVEDGELKIHVVKSVSSSQSVRIWLSTEHLSKLSASGSVISISGSGKANVQANRTLKVDVSGSGSVKYLGTPEIVKNISGSGSVKPVE